MPFVHFSANDMRLADALVIFILSLSYLLFYTTVFIHSAI